MRHLGAVRLPGEAGPPHQPVSARSGGRHALPDSAALPHIRAGKLRALGVTTRERTPLLDVPTLIEQGVADFDVNAWFGLMAPAGTPREIVLRLNADSVKALRQGATRERLESVGLTPAPGTPEEFGRFMAGELERWAKVAKAAQIRAE